MWSLLALLGCAQPPPLPPASHPPATHRVTGDIREIRLLNINKAQGHYTYNVELGIGVAAITPDVPHEAVVRVRLPRRPTWTSMSEEERRSLSPNGPQHVLDAARWDGYAVGDPVDLPVAMTGPGLALLSSEPVSGGHEPPP